MRHINILKSMPESRVLTKLIIDMYTEYFKEIHGDEFIGNESTIKAMLDASLEGNNIITLVYDGLGLVGFFEYRMDSEADNVAPFVYLKYMYIKPQYRNGTAIGYMYEYMALVSHMNDDCKLVGDTYLSSNNIHNNIKAGGDVISNTFKFTPKDSALGRKLIRRGLKRYESH